MKKRLKELKENLKSAILEIEDMEKELTNSKYKIEINNKIYRVTSAIGIINKLVEIIGKHTIYKSKYSYRTTKINDVKVDCPVIINENSANFKHLIKAFNGRLYKRLDDKYYLYSNMDTEEIIRNSQKLASKYGIQFKLIN
jgi:hypothetical protein